MAQHWRGKYCAVEGVFGVNRSGASLSAEPIRAASPAMPCGHTPGSIGWRMHMICASRMRRRRIGAPNVKTFRGMSFVCVLHCLNP